MFCENCGCELTPGTPICPVCGKKVENGAAVQDTEKTADIGKNLADRAEQKNTPVMDAEQKAQEQTPVNVSVMQAEEGTTVLAAEPEDDAEAGTTVLNSNMMPNGVAANRPIPNGQMPNRPMPNGQMPNRPMPNGQMPNRPMPNGMAPNRPMPNGQMPNRPMPNGQAPGAQNPAEGKKAKKAKNKQAKPKKQKGKGGKIALLVTLIVVVLAVGGAAAFFVPKVLNYNKAEEAVKDGDIEKAMELYGKAKPIKDAKEKVNGGAYYDYAAMLEADGDYPTAAENYKQAAALEYKDAATKEKECYYKQGEKLYAEANYTDAATYYALAGDYESAAEKVKECSYMNGAALAAEKKYDEAVQAYTDAGDYQDAAEKIKECYYNNAVDKKAAGDYSGAKDLFAQSEYSDYASQMNECLCLLAAQYDAAGDYQAAIDTYAQVDPTYKDCTADADNVRIKWAETLVAGGDYKSAVDMYAQVTTQKVTKKIKEAKAAYIAAHYDRSDETTMNYVCDLKQAEYGTAEQDYTNLLGWTVESFVNDGKENYDDKNDSVSSAGTIYIHTMFLTDNGGTINLKGYVVYSDGTQSNEVSFGEVQNSYTTWMSIDSGQAIAGTATLYIYEVDTNYLIEKYAFTIE